MTVSGSKAGMRLKNKVDAGRVSAMIYAAIGIFALALVIRNGEIAAGYVKSGMSLCVNTVIPSLFPFMVVANMLSVVDYSTVTWILEPISRAVFGFGGEIVPIVLVGNVCGVPVGAKLGAKLCECGRITRSELERALLYCCNPSAAFVIFGVGVSLFGSRELGVRLYLITLLSSFACGSLGRLVIEKEEIGCSICGADCSEKKGFFKIFSSAVSDAAASLVGISAFVVFFTAFTGIVGNMCEHYAVADEFRALLGGFFEMTGGTASSSLLGDRKMAFATSAFCLGWSGFSVHLQIFSMVEKTRLRFWRYLLFKLLQGGVAFLLAFLTF